MAYGHKMPTSHPARPEGTHANHTMVSAELGPAVISHAVISHLMAYGHKIPTSHPARPEGPRNADSRPAGPLQGTHAPPPACPPRPIAPPQWARCRPPSTSTSPCPSPPTSPRRALPPLPASPFSCRLSHPRICAGDGRPAGLARAGAPDSRGPRDARGSVSVIHACGRARARARTRLHT